MTDPRSVDSSEGQDFSISSELPIPSAVALAHCAHQYIDNSEMSYDTTPRVPGYSEVLSSQQADDEIRSTSETARIADEFAELRDRWREKTGHYSVMIDAVIVPEYQRIIGMGEAALPLIIECLKEPGPEWFWALIAIVGVDHAAGATTVTEACDRWIEWYEKDRAQLH